MSARGRSRRSTAFPTRTGLRRNFGWPCYEGEQQQPGFDAVDLTICENLYAQSGRNDTALLPVPARAKGRLDRDVLRRRRARRCPGFAFTPANSTFPSSYDNALFFADYSRRCIWVMSPDGSGIPNPATVTPFVQDASFPVDLQFGPTATCTTSTSPRDPSADPTSPATSHPSRSRRAHRPAGPPRSWSASTARARATPTERSPPTPGTSTETGRRRLDGAEPVSHVHASARTSVRLRVTDNQGAPDLSGPDYDHRREQPRRPPSSTSRPHRSPGARRRDRVHGSRHGSRGRDDSGIRIPLGRDALALQLAGQLSCHFVQSFPGVASGSFSAPITSIRRSSN